ncbi:TetR family transcriptional regulator [Rubrivirga litoralis]|uniref:TetR family transcriptional regulator n=1 Tax=Rubrivirga litoralis TaxID=3075598 RepID=A0ABU3BQF8_9BACT|nr:TetR family transcriptional regulator [Rubrivirga sp. F394]MDT0631526.1 TetR family transcriptional regulator [Rubrivirga sp. F394]
MPAPPAAPADPPRPGEGSREVTRRALLRGARRLFSERGYDHVGVREIAATANVNAALINRYFGSKLGLFQEAVAESFTVGNLLVGDRATLGDRLARYLVRPRPGGFDPTLVLLRSAASPEAGGVLRAALADDVAAPLAAWLGGADARERAGLVAAVLFGFALGRDVAAVPALADGDRAALAGHLGAVLQRLIDGA